MRRGARSIPALLVAAAALVGACSETGTDPEAVVSISFDSLPAPSIVEGDTLRDDSTGVVAALAPVAFNGKADTIRNAPFRFFVRDTGGALAIDSVRGIVVARKPRAAAANFVASLGNLQLAQSLLIVPRPDSLGAPDSVKTLQLATPEVPTDLLRNLTPPCTVRVLHDSLAAGVRVAVNVPVRGWVVFYRVDTAATKVADSVRLVNELGRRQAKDTTNESGYAALHVRVYAKPAPASGAVTDTVVVRAFVRYRGVELRGSPHRFAIPVRVGQTP